MQEALLYDITQQTKKFHQFILQSIIFSGVLCLLLFGIAWRTLGRVDRTVHDAQQNLANEVTKAEKANKMLEIEINERKKVEESLVHLNAHLEEKGIERTEHLK